jgi:hypothetical protein
MIRDVHPESRIRILIFYPSRIQGSKRPRIRIRNTARRRENSCMKSVFRMLVGQNVGTVISFASAALAGMCLFLNMIQRLERRPPERRLAQ